MDNSQHKQLFEWFLPQLEQAWDEQLSGSAQVLGQRYVQWSGSDLGLQLECSSNRTLTGADRLLAHQVRSLRKQGWRVPAGRDMPNFWRVFFDREELLDATVALIAAVEVLRVPAFVPTPAPDTSRQPEPAADQPGRCVFVVPVIEVSVRELTLAQNAAVAAFEVCALMNLSGVDLANELRQLSFKDAVTGVVPLPGSAAVTPGAPMQVATVPDAARTLGHAMGKLQRLRRRGLDVVVVLPTLRLELANLYAACMDDSDAALFVVQPQEDGHLSWGALRGVIRSLTPLLPPRLLAVAEDYRGSVLRALPPLHSALSHPESSVRAAASTRLLAEIWDREEHVWPEAYVREALLQGRLRPLRSRLVSLPDELDCPHDVEAALQVLHALFTIVQEHLEHLQDVGFGALGSLRRLPLLLERACQQGVAGAREANSMLSWLAECGADGAEVFAVATATPGRAVQAEPGPLVEFHASPAAGPSATEMHDPLASIGDLNPQAQVKKLLQALVAGPPVRLARRRDYVSLRPETGGAIALYAHRDHVSIALPPARAAEWAAKIDGAMLEGRSGRATYLRVPAPSIASAPDLVVAACQEAIAWRAAKPPLLG